MPDLVKSFGLPEQKWAFDLLRGLKKDGYSLGRDTAAQFARAAALKPASADAQSWMESADVAFRRGLPMTETTIASLREALFGAPLSVRLRQLQTLLADWTARPDFAGGANSAAVRLQALLGQGAELLAEGAASLRLGAPTAGPAGANPAEGAPAAAAPTDGAAAPAGESAAAAGRNAPQGGTAHAAAEPAANPAAAAAAGRREAGAPATAARPEPTGAAQPREAAEAQPQRQPAARPAPVAAEPAAAKPPEALPVRGGGGDPGWLGRFLQWLGVGHEHRALQQAAERMDTGLGQAARNVVDESAAAAPARSGETLKGALLALAADETAPPPLREAAGSLAQHVTGQQLLLADRQGEAAPFSMMTLFVPLKGPDGDGSAAVHVQTRKGRRGEWDADNCRLLFDLRMRHLGETVVDVQVVNRIVSLKLFSDYAGMGDLVDEARGELSEGLRAAGYQLLSLSAAPMPGLPEAAPRASAAADAARPDRAVGAAYAAKPYKGVDYRV
jgi:hypothetical protein